MSAETLVRCTRRDIHTRCKGFMHVHVRIYKNVYCTCISTCTYVCTAAYVYIHPRDRISIHLTNSAASRWLSCVFMTSRATGSGAGDSVGLRGVERFRAFWSVQAASTQMAHELPSTLRIVVLDEGQT